MISKRLKELREYKNIMQDILAKELGVKQATISFYENGKRQPDEETLIKLTNFYNVSMDYLYGLTDIKKRLTLDKEQSKLLNSFNELNKDNQNMIIGMSELKLLEQQKITQGTIKRSSVS